MGHIWICLRSHFGSAHLTIPWANSVRVWPQGITPGNALREWASGGIFFPSPSQGKIHSGNHSEVVREEKLPPLATGMFGTENVRRPFLSLLVDNFLHYYFRRKMFEIFILSCGKYQTKFCLFISSGKFETSGFFVVEYLRRLVSLCWKMSDGHKISNGAFPCDGKCQTVTKNPVMSFLVMENVRRS